MLVAELRVAELHLFGKPTLQSIGEFLNIEGYEDMTRIMLIEAIEEEVGLLLFVINDQLLVGDLVPPF